MKEIEKHQIGVDRLSALDMHDGRQRLRGKGGLDVRDAAADAQSALRGAFEP